MSIQQRRDEYLSKAREAEESAAKAKDDENRESWRKIAEGYRQLARNSQNL